MKRGEQGTCRRLMKGKSRTEVSGFPAALPLIGTLLVASGSIASYELLEGRTPPRQIEPPAKEQNAQDAMSWKIQEVANTLQELEAIDPRYAALLPSATMRPFPPADLAAVRTIFDDPVINAHMDQAPMLLVRVRRRGIIPELCMGTSSTEACYNVGTNIVYEANDSSPQRRRHELIHAHMALYTGGYIKFDGPNGAVIERMSRIMKEGITELLTAEITASAFRTHVEVTRACVDPECLRVMVYTDRTWLPVSYPTEVRTVALIRAVVGQEQFLEAVKSGNWTNVKATFNRRVGLGVFDMVMERMHNETESERNQDPSPAACRTLNLAYGWAWAVSAVDETLRRDLNELKGTRLWRRLSTVECYRFTGEL